MKLSLKDTLAFQSNIMIANHSQCLITSCIQLEDHYYVLGIINVYKQLLPLKIFRIEWNDQFFLKSTIDILTD